MRLDFINTSLIKKGQLVKKKEVENRILLEYDTPEFILFLFKKVELGFRVKQLDSLSISFAKEQVSREEFLKLSELFSQNLGVDSHNEGIDYSFEQSSMQEWFVVLNSGEIFRPPMDKAVLSEEQICCIHIFYIEGYLEVGLTNCELFFPELLKLPN